MRKIVIAIFMTVFLCGCASVQFPRLGASPERPSVKSNWEETHTRETDYAALMMAMDEYKATGKITNVPITKETNTFSVGHSDSRKATANPFVTFFRWVLGLGALGTFLWFGGGTLLVAFIGIFIKKFIEIRAALWQTVAGIKAAGEAKKRGSATHTALETTQDEKTKVLVKSIAAKVKVNPIV